MKIRLLISIPCILAFLFTGCTSTYVKKDFSSESDFLKKINENTGSADICMTNDSLVKAKELKVDNDSVKYEACYQKVSSDKSTGSYYGSILMETRKSSIPLNEVKNISFVNHSGPNIGYGLLTGVAAGGVISGLLLKMGYDSNSGHHTYGFITQAIPGAIAGGLVGLITGMLIGQKELFIFNNPLPKENFNSTNYNHRFGIRVGWLSGFNYNVRDMDGVNEYYARVKGEGIPGYAVSLLYNYPFSSQMSMNGELSYISIGSEAHTSLKVPGNQDYYFTSSRSDEKLKIIELAVPLRLNLFRSPDSFYFLAGPKLDILFPGESGISNFLTSIKNQYNFEGQSVSAEYKKWVLGVTFGGGITTGSMLPVELLIEARYNYDLTPRFEMNYISPKSNNFNSSLFFIPTANTRMPYKSSEFQLSIGAAIF